MNTNTRTAAPFSATRQSGRGTANMLPLARLFEAAC
jgi:hypothetical protein